MSDDTTIEPVEPAPAEATPDVIVEPKTSKTEPKAEAKHAVHAGLPANGQELHRRLQDYDAKLAQQWMDEGKLPNLSKKFR